MRRVRDRITVRKDIHSHGEYGGIHLLDGMMTYKGKDFTITGIIHVGEINHFHVKETGYIWSEEMFEPETKITPEKFYNTIMESK